CVFPPAVEWRTSASKDGMPASGTYSVQAVRVLDTHHTPIQKQPEALLCLVGISRRYYLGDDVDGSIQLNTCSQSNKEMDEPAVATDSSGVPGCEGIDANAPPKSLRRDHADLQPSGSSRGGKSLAAMQLCLASNIFMYEGIPADVSDPDPLAFADAPSPRPADVVRSSQGVAAVGDPGSENVSSPTVVGSPGSVSGEETPKAAFEDYKRQQDQMVEQRCAKMDARQDAMSIDFDEELYPHMLTAIAGRRWVIGHGLRLVTMKCAESLEMRQAFADVASAGIAKGMKSLEAYDPEAEAKFSAALQSLKDLKLPLLDQLDGLKDAPMDVIMASLYLEDDTGDDAL
nr:hypothetical protein [Tanacetum cinerariifolium]